MSLTWRLTNLFASGPSPDLVPASQVLDGSEHIGGRQNGADSTFARKIKRMRAMEETEVDHDIELKRPPYRHVCYSSLIPGHGMLTSLAVNACWRDRRYQW